MRLFILCTAALLSSHAASAADISVIGLFPGKAVLVIDGASPKTYSVGSTLSQGVTLIAADGSSATINDNGKRQKIAIGEYVSARASSGPATTILNADGRGHFIAQGQINGGTIRLLVDTGATMVSLPAADATRLGINYRHGRKGSVNTANGIAPAYLVKLDTIKIGDIELNQVDALVQENGLSLPLLGMSFLNRIDMQRSGDQMVLTKRY